MGGERLDQLRLTRLWIYREGPNIFSGNSLATKTTALSLGQLEEEKLKALLNGMAP